MGPTMSPTTTATTTSSSTKPTTSPSPLDVPSITAATSANPDGPDQQNGPQRNGDEDQAVDEERHPVAQAGEEREPHRLHCGRAAQRDERRREPVEHREDRPDDEDDEQAEYRRPGYRAQRTGQCFERISGRQHVRDRDPAEDACRDDRHDAKHEGDVDGADDHERYEVRALEAFEQVCDAQASRLARSPGIPA